MINDHNHHINRIAAITKVLTSVSAFRFHIVIDFCLTSTGVCNILGGGGYMPKPPLLCNPLAGLGVYNEDLGLNRRIGPPDEYTPPSSRAAAPLFLDPCKNSQGPLLLHIDNDK